MKREDITVRKQGKQLQQLLKKIDEAIVKEEEKEEDFQKAMRKIFSTRGYDE